VAPLINTQKILDVYSSMGIGGGGGFFVSLEIQISGKEKWVKDPKSFFPPELSLFFSELLNL